MKRLLCLLLTLFTCLGLLLSCANVPEQPNDTDDPMSSSAVDSSGPPAASEIVLAAPGEAPKYVLIRPEDCGPALLDKVKDLRANICSMIDGSITIKSDWYKNESDIADCEIVIGNTNRAESATYADQLGGYDWYITMVGQKLIINGGSEAAVVAALDHFMKEYVEGRERLAVPAEIDERYVSETNMIKVLDVKDKIKIIGRYSEAKNGITCDWTASGIEFTADCEGEVMVGVISSKSSSGSSYDGDSYFTAYVDGVRVETRLEVKPGDEVQLLLAAGLERGTHTFRLLKQSHVAHSGTVITTISLNGTISERPENRQHYIEFYGDSITCGYGLASEYVKSVAGTANNDAYYCDGTKAYAFLTAEALNADYSMVSVSGWRLAGDSSAIPKTCYPFINWYRGGAKYDFSARVPDVIVINLGTNDYSASIGDARFASDTQTWIKRIRSDYGRSDLPIIFVVNAMNDGYQTVIKKTLTDMGGEAAGLYVLKTVQNRGGLSNHPTCAGQLKTAELLTAFIQQHGLLK